MLAGVRLASRCLASLSALTPRGRLSTAFRLVSCSEVCRRRQARTLPSIGCYRVVRSASHPHLVKKGAHLAYNLIPQTSLSSSWKDALFTSLFTRKRFISAMPPHNSFTSPSTFLPSFLLVAVRGIHLSGRAIQCIVKAALEWSRRCIQCPYYPSLPLQ